MAGTGGASDQRVTVQVVPDTSKLRRELQKTIQELEKTLKLRLKVEADIRSAQLAVTKFRKTAEGKAVRLNASLNGNGVLAELNKLTRDRKVSITTEVSTKASSKKIDSLTRNRMVTVTPLVKPIPDQKVSIKPDVSSGLGASLKLAFLSRRRHASIVPQVPLAPMAAAEAALSALSNGFSLERSVGQAKNLLGGLAAKEVAGLALALPAVLTGAAIGVSVLAVAWKNAGTELAHLGPTFSSLSNSISGTYWNQARGPITEMVNTLLPDLRQGLDGVAFDLGNMTGEFARSFSQAHANGVLVEIFQNLRAALQQAQPAIEPLVQAFTTLTQIGSRFLPSIGQWLAEIATQFNAWVQAAAESGQLEAFISQAAQQFGLLIDVILSVGSIVMGLFNALGSSDSWLSMLSNGLGEVADLVNSPIFQVGLQTIFHGAADGARGLGSALGPIGDGIIALAPSIGGAFATLGQTAGDLIGGIFSALSQPAASNGLTDLVGGIQKGVEGLMPSLPALADAFGAIMSLAGKLAEHLGPILGAAIEVLGPVVEQLVKAFMPLIDIVGPILVDVIGQIGEMIIPIMPVVATIIEVVGALVLALAPIIAVLVGAFIPIFEALAPVIGKVVELLGQILVPIIEALTPVIQLLLPVIEEMAKTMGERLMELLVTLGPVIMMIVQAFVDLMPALMPVIEAVIKLLPALMDLLMPLMPLVSSLLPTLIGLFSLVLPPILYLVQAIITNLLPAFQSIIQILSGVINFVVGVFTGDWGRAWQGIVDIVSGIFGTIGNVVKGVLNIVIDAINGAVGGINDIISGVGGVFGVDVKIPKIPRLALGATVLPQPGGTLAVLAEAGRAETVVDTGKMNALMDLVIRRDSGRNPGMNEFTQENHFYERAEDPRILMRVAGAEFQTMTAGVLV